MSRWIGKGYVVLWYRMVSYGFHMCMVGAEQYGRMVWRVRVCSRRSWAPALHSGTWGAAAKRLLASGASVHP